MDAVELLRPQVVHLARLRTTSTLNARVSWYARHRQNQAQRTMVLRLLQATYGLTCPWSLPLTVTLTRIAPRALDQGDNLPGALKSCRDGVSDYLSGGTYGRGKDNLPGLTWRYAQRRGSVGEYGVEIRLEGTACA